MLEMDHRFADNGMFLLSSYNPNFASYLYHENITNWYSVLVIFEELR